VAQTVVGEGVWTIGGEGMQIAVGEGEEVRTVVEEGEGMQTVVEDGEGAQTVVEEGEGAWTVIAPLERVAMKGFGDWPLLKDRSKASGEIFLMASDSKASLP